MDRELFDLHARLEDEHWWFKGRRRIIVDLVHALLPARKGRRVLDIGCGTGANIAALSSDYECTGVDPSTHAVERARQRFPHVHFERGVAPHDLPVPVRSADLVMMCDVIEHVADDRDLVTGIVQEMAPGALLLITVPADPELWSNHDVVFGHYRRYERDELLSVLQPLPLERVLVSAFNSRLYPVVKAVRAVRNRMGAVGSSQSDLSLPPGPLNAVLTSVFAGERSRLLRSLEDEGRSGFRRGVSLIAIMRKASAQ